MCYSKIVRVDFFKQSGKWHAKEGMLWDRYKSVDSNGYESLRDTFLRCLKNQFGDRYNGMIAVCLEPYHEHSYPVMVTK